MALSQEPKTKVDHIKARFGGRDLVFKIPRENLAGFESGIGEPAQIRFRKIVQGEASFDSVLRVLEYAAPNDLGRRIPRSEMDMMREELAKRGRPRNYPQIGEHSTFVAKTLAANPPAKYSLLAQAVIAACLYGVPEDAAVFDEDEVDLEEGEPNAES